MASASSTVAVNTPGPLVPMLAMYAHAIPSQIGNVFGNKQLGLSAVHVCRVRNVRPLYMVNPSEE